MSDDDERRETAPTGRRAPTAAEARALGHPLRLKILFACRDRARTNKELADSLAANPGTVLYHVRQLLDQGFLRPDEPRPGPRGSREQPYRSTGKSWSLDGGHDRTPALRQVMADELLRAGDDDQITLSRLGLSLDPEEVEELVARLAALLEEFATRSRTAPSARAAATPEDLGSLTLLVSLQRQPSDGPGTVPPGRA